MLDFCTLIVELLKIQDYLHNFHVDVKTVWSDNHNNDRLILTSRKNFNLCQFVIERYKWDHHREFMLIDSVGQHHYLIDPITEQPRAIDKVNLLTNIWASVHLPIGDTRDFAQEVFNLFKNLKQKLDQHKSQLFHEIASSRN